MKIFNACLEGISTYKDRYYYHFSYKSQFIDGYGVIVVTSFSPVNIVKKGHYDIYMSDKDGYHTLRAIYEHTDKNTDRNTIDSI